MTLKKQYLSDSISHIPNEEILDSLIETHHCEMKLAESRWSYTILSYDENDVLDNIEIINKDRDNEIVPLKVENFKFKEYRKNYFYNFRFDEKGKHDFFGPAPVGFEIPKPKCAHLFHYLGKISRGSKVLNWLPFDFHLIAPIHMGFDAIWLDYTNPEAPEIVNKEEVDRYQNTVNDPASDCFMSYGHKKATLKKGASFNEKVGFTGTPIWMQGFFEMRCPKNKKTRD